MSTQTQRVNALATLPDNRLQISHTIADGWLAVEFLAGREHRRVALASWPDVIKHARSYGGMITCSALVGLALRDSGMLVVEQEKRYVQS